MSSTQTRKEDYEIKNLLRYAVDDKAIKKPKEDYITTYFSISSPNCFEILSPEKPKVGRKKKNSGK